MTLQTLEPQTSHLIEAGRGSYRSSPLRERETSISRRRVLTPLIDTPATLEQLPSRSVYVDDSDELGRRILESALSNESDSFAVKCRSTQRATEFATPMRSLLLTLNSGFGGVSATVSPALLLHTYPAMDALVTDLEESGAAELWQPIGERSLGIGDAKHIFVSVDTPVLDTSHRSSPDVMVEVVGAHLISTDWFDSVVMRRCQSPALSFVFYGQAGFAGSLFDRAWATSDVKGEI